MRVIVSNIPASRGGGGRMQAGSRRGKGEVLVPVSLFPPWFLFLFLVVSRHDLQYSDPGELAS